MFKNCAAFESKLAERRDKKCQEKVVLQCITQNDSELRFDLKAMAIHVRP